MSGSGGPGFLGEQITKRLAGVMEHYGIQPGELNDRIKDTLDLLHELEPVARSMADTSANLERDIDELKGEIKEFNENAGDLADSMNNLSETMDKFTDFVEDIEEQSE